MKMKCLAKLVLAGSIFFPVFAGVNSVEAASVTDEIVETGKSLIGVPYAWGGTTTKGFDCSGFMRYVYSNEGIKLPRVASEQYKVGESVSKSELIPGDAVFFETYKKGASHAGIYIGDNKFVHASSSKGVTITSLDSSYYKKRYLGAKRYVDEALAAPPPVVDQEGYFRGLKIKNGQVGVIEVKKAINLWERDENNKITMVRILQPGEKYRVYSFDSLHGGQYGLGANQFITKMDAHIDFYSL